jgi:hypothetical protein
MHLSNITRSGHSILKKTKDEWITDKSEKKRNQKFHNNMLIVLPGKRLGCNYYPKFKNTMNGTFIIKMDAQKNGIYQGNFRSVGIVKS